VAHGGHCVARLDGRVVFVRHALPGERVRAVVTERRGGYLRADAVRVLTPSPDRVEPPCPYARPGRCGGCDFQHATPAAQREMKAAVLREHLSRTARLPADRVEPLGVRVEPLPGGPLGWRSRVQYAVAADGRLGFHRYRSHDVVPVDRCPIAHPAIQALPLTGQRWPAGWLDVVASSTGDVTVLSRRARRGGGPGGRGGDRGGRGGDRGGRGGDRGGRGGTDLVSGAGLVRERAAGRDWTLGADAFWQVHPAAPDILAEAVRQLLAPRPGEHALDLYSGAGLFAAAVAADVGAAGRVTAVEADPRGVAAARHSLTDLPWLRAYRADVAAELRGTRWPRVDLVVLDPPRAGVGAAVVEGVARRRPRAVAYVSCDPAAFARDVAAFAAAGYRLDRLRGYDAFPMTHHVECVGLLTPQAGRH
jgi:tRNA/tmRNA/rRNA uracil-C5-methylase (TrmA/RlmC/RlmD family)